MSRSRARPRRQLVLAESRRSSQFADWSRVEREATEEAVRAKLETLEQPRPHMLLKLPRRTRQKRRLQSPIRRRVWRHGGEVRAARQLGGRLRVECGRARRPRRLFRRRDGEEVAAGRMHWTATGGGGPAARLSDSPMADSDKSAGSVLALPADLSQVDETLLRGEIGDGMPLLRGGGGGARIKGEKVGRRGAMRTCTGRGLECCGDRKRTRRAGGAWAHGGETGWGSMGDICVGGPGG